MSDYLTNRLNKTAHPIPQQGGAIPFEQDLPPQISHYDFKKMITRDLQVLMANSKEDPTENMLKTTLLSLAGRYGIQDQKMQKEVLEEIFNDIMGYGVLEEFIKDKDVTEIIVNKFDNIWVEKKGRMMKTNVKFNSEEELRNLIDKIVQPLGRRIDDNQPMVNARLKDKSRVNAVIPPIAADGATLDIRKFAEKAFTAEDYLNFGSITREMIDFIKYSVIVKKNIIVSGGTGSGKTTLLNFLSNYIPENEAIITIEDLLELQLAQPHLRRLEARGKNAEGTGEVSIRDLLINALRMRPDRIVVGECRSFEVIDMLQAMNTGHDGSLTTAHANNPKDCLERLYVMYLMGMDVSETAVKSQIASALDLVVQVQRLPSGRRVVTQVSEVLGYGKTGIERNNEWVEKMGLNPKFHAKNGKNNEFFIQDIFRYNKLTEKFEATGWIPTYIETIEKEIGKLDRTMFNERFF